MFTIFAFLVLMACPFACSTHNETTILSGLTQGTVPNFGASISISGQCMLIGIPRSSEAATNAGAAHLYCFDGSAWTRNSRLTASSPSSGDDFGFSVALSSNIAVVGARNHDDNVVTAGAAYVFRQVGTSWSETQYIVASDQHEADYFGYSVAVSDSLLLVGSPRRDDIALNSGSVYAYRSVNGGVTWLFESKLTAVGSYGM